jgi:hypothetical protein
VHVISATVVLVVGASAGSASASTYHAHDGASLQAAVAGADAASGASTIDLTAGAFLPTSTLTITRDVTIVGPASAPGAKLAGSAVEPFPADLISVEAHARLTLLNVSLTASGGAGTPAIDDAGSVALESSTVAGNNGPGLLVQPGASASVTNSTLSDGLDAGLVDQGSASVLNSTIAGNATGGIDDSSGTLRLTNTIVAENSSSDCTKRATSSDHSLDSDGSCGVGALSRANPVLGRLIGNGGPTSTQALGVGSPAIGAGDLPQCPAEDQRHFARPAGSCDIGAFQAGAILGGPGASPGAGPGSLPSSGVGSRLVGVSAHGALRGARHSRIPFTLRAQLGHSSNPFQYTDRARRVALRALKVKSLAFNQRLGVATVRGTVEVTATRRRMAVTIVLSDHLGRRAMRIGLSNGYYVSGTLASGSVTFIRSPSAG